MGAMAFLNYLFKKLYKVGKQEVCRDWHPAAMISNIQEYKK